MLRFPQYEARFPKEGFCVPSQVLLFGRRATLYQKYHLDPQAIQILSPEGVTLPPVSNMLNQLLKTHEHALKNKLLGNLSNRYMATTAVLWNGSQATAANIEHNRDTASLCAERSALVTVWNQALQRLKLPVFKKEKPIESMKEGLVGDGLAVRYLYLSSADLGNVNDTTPCSDCQTWMSTQRYFRPDTVLISLIRLDNDQFAIRARRVQDLLPYSLLPRQHWSSLPLSALPVAISEQAQRVLAQMALSQSVLLNLLAQAKQVYLDNQAAPVSGKDTAVAAYFNAGEMFTSARTDWTARWFQSADLQTVSQGVQTLLHRGLRQVSLKALAYYGEDPQLPSVESLGKLAQRVWGNPECLMVIVEDETIQIRLLKEYMTDIYRASFIPKPSGKVS